MVSEIGQLAARNVRRYRTERQFSIGELSRRSGLSKQTLSKLEQGEGNPTVETLDAVAAALNLSVRRLLTEWGSPVYVVRKDDGDWASGELQQSKLLDEIYGSGFVRTSLLRLERVGTSPAIDRSDGHARGSLHHCYVVAGKIRLGPDGDTVVAAQGDFVRFPADTPHTYEALSASALVHMVTTLPGVPQFGPTEQR